MINHSQKKSLMANWGEKANSMNCYAEVKFFDECSKWACYIYAMDPLDEDSISCLIDGQDIDVCRWSLRELHLTYNENGDHPKRDEEFRKVRVAELFKKLSEEK